MKTRSRQAFLYTSLLCMSLTILLASCEVAGGIAATAIDRIPVFSGETVTSRSPIPAGISMEDLFFSVFTPPLTRFAPAPAGVVVGDTILVDLFGNPVTLETSEDNGVIVFSGIIQETASDGTSVETGTIELKYNPTNPTFTLHTEVLMTDPDDQLGWGQDMYFYLIVDVPETAIAADDSFISKYEALAFIGKALEIQYMDALEMYSGPTGTGEWVVGFGGMTFTDKLVTEIGLNPDNFGPMVNSSGIPLPSAQFSPIRQAIQNLKTTMRSHIEDNGAPALGYRTYPAAGPTTTTLFNDTAQNGTNPELYIIDSTGGYLKNSEGTDLLFPWDEANNNNPAKTLDNVRTFISGFPASAWRDNSSLVEVYTLKGFTGP